MPDACGQKPFMTCWTIKYHFHYNLAINSDFISILSRFHFRPNSVNLKFLSFGITHNLGIGKRYAQTWEKLTTPWKNPCYWRSEGPRFIQHLWLLIPLWPPRWGLPLRHLCPNLYSYVAHQVTSEPLGKNVIKESSVGPFWPKPKFLRLLQSRIEKPGMASLPSEWQGQQASCRSVWRSLKRRVR